MEDCCVGIIHFCKSCSGGKSSEECADEDDEEDDQPSHSHDLSHSLFSVDFDDDIIDGIDQREEKNCYTGVELVSCYGEEGKGFCAHHFSGEDTKNVYSYKDVHLIQFWHRNKRLIG